MSRVEKNVSAIVLSLWPVKRVCSHSSEHFQYLLKFMIITFAHEGGQGYINEFSHVKDYCNKMLIYKP